jgi:hypothetical protein
VIVFYYVDDIVFIYRKQDRPMADQAIEGLKKQFEMTECGELKWFLGVHVARDRQKRQLWLSQSSYIEKIANQFGLDHSSKPPDTPMLQAELLPSLDQATRKSTLEYQSKVGSILYAAITTRPDVAFAASKLAQFNANPSQQHHDAADRTIEYLYHTRNRAISYRAEGNTPCFICASDASFADDSTDRKSSQGYVMMLFSGPISWRANKQDTVTTSSTEAELLAMSQTAKEAIWLGRLFRAMLLELDEPLAIQCDNRQTIRLICEESAKLQTKLRHVDIHNHWLRQEYASGRIQVNWKETTEMVADGLTKALPKIKFSTFVSQLGIQEIGERLSMIRRMEELRDQIQSAKEQELELKTGGRSIKKQ